MLGYVMATTLGAAHASDILLLSLGTGEPEIPEGEDITQIMGDEWWGAVVRPAANCLSAGAGHLARELLQSIPGLYYRRLQPKLGTGVDPRMDNATPGNILALRKAAEDFVRQHEAALRKIAAALVRDSGTG
jgi:hypothetical protein